MSEELRKEEEVMARESEVKLTDLRRLVSFQKNGDLYYLRPTFPPVFKEQLAAGVRAGDTYQWDYEMVDGRPKFTFEFNPQTEPKVLAVLNKKVAQE